MIALKIFVQAVATIKLNLGLYEGHEMDPAERTPLLLMVYKPAKHCKNSLESYKREAMDV